MTAPFPAPGTATWGQGATPPSPTKRSSAVIVAASVAAIALVGGAVALVNVGRDKPTSTVTDPREVVKHHEVILPTGPAPAPPETAVTVPGPQPPPTVTTLPPPTTSPPTTLPDTGPIDTGATVSLGSGSVTIPQGWTITNVSDGYVLLDTDGAEFEAFLVDVAVVSDTADATGLLVSYVEDLLSNQVEDLELADVVPVDLPSAAYVSGAGTSFQAAVVTQQGSTPVEGVVLAFVLQDGTGVLMDTLNLLGDFDTHSADYDLMATSILFSLG